MEKTFDSEQTLKFLQMLDPQVEKFAFSCFKKTKDRDYPKPPIYGSYPELESTFTLRQRNGYNVTIVVNEGREEKVSLADITRLRCVFIDFDSKLVGQTLEYSGGRKHLSNPLDLDKLKNFNFPPRMIVESSPGNYHAYWPINSVALDETAENVEQLISAYQELQTELGIYFGADPSTTAVNKCMRIPGWWRFKEDDGLEPTLVNIIWEDDTDIRYNAQYLLSEVRKLNKLGAKPAKAQEKENEEDKAESEADNEAKGSFVDDNAKGLASQWLKEACEKLSQAGDGGRDNLLNKTCWTAGGYIAGGALLEEPTKDAIQEAAVACGLDSGRIRDKLTRVINQGKNKPIYVESNLIVMEKVATNSINYLKDNFLWVYKNKPYIAFLNWRGSLWVYDGGQYVEWEVEDLHHSIRNWLVTRKRRVKIGEKIVAVKLEPKSSDWVELGKQVSTGYHKSKDLESNTWLPDATNIIPIRYCVPFKNGLYDIRSDNLNGPNPYYFNTSCVKVDYSPEEVKAPDNWLKFLDEIFYDEEEERVDQESIDLLQEWIGYCLTGDVSRHKMMMIVGPPRSGKGTIEGVIRNILGSRNIGTFDFATLNTEFGMEQMVGKTLSTCSDVRESAKDMNRVVETLLKVSANDPVSVNRKKIKIDNIKLHTKIMMFANEVPSYKDKAGAIHARTMFIQTLQSFEGRVNLDLANTLSEETQSITHWSLDGLKRLLDKGEFTMSKFGEKLRRELRGNDSPIIGFLEDNVEFHKENCCNKDWLFDSYLDWASANGTRFLKDKQGLMKELVGLKRNELKMRQSAAGYGKRVSYLSGIGLVKDENRRNYTSTKPPGGENYPRPLYEVTQKDRGEKDVPF